MKEYKNEQEFLNDYYEEIRQQEKPRCCICKFYNSDRRNENGQARCTKHPFWVKDNEACDSYESGVHVDWRMPPSISKPKKKQEEEPKEKNFNWGWKILVALIFLPFVILALLPIIRALERIWELSKDNVGLFFFNLVAFPLGIVGGVKVFMGVFELAGNYAEEHNITKDWQVGLYGLLYNSPIQG